MSAESASPVITWCTPCAGTRPPCTAVNFRTDAPSAARVCKALRTFAATWCRSIRCRLTIGAIYAMRIFARNGRCICTCWLSILWCPVWNNELLIFFKIGYFCSFGFIPDTLSSDRKMWYINISILYGLCIWWLWVWFYIKLIIWSCGILLENCQLSIVVKFSFPSLLVFRINFSLIEPTIIGFSWEIFLPNPLLTYSHT